MKILKVIVWILVAVLLLGSISAVAAKTDPDKEGGFGSGIKDWFDGIKDKVEDIFDKESESETENPYEDNPLTVGEWKYLGKVETVTDVQAEPYKVAKVFDVMLDGGLFAYHLEYSNNWGGAYVRIICDKTVDGETDTELLYTFSYDGTESDAGDGITGTFEIAPPEEGAVRSNLRMVVYDDCEYEVYAFEGPAGTADEKTWFTAGQWMSLGTVPTVSDLGAEPYEVAESFDVMLEGGMFAYSLTESSNYGDGKIKIVCTETDAAGVETEVTLFDACYFKAETSDGEVTYEFDSESGKFIGRFEIEAPAEGVTRSNLRMVVFDGCEFQVYAYCG